LISGPHRNARFATLALAVAALSSSACRPFEDSCSCPRGGVVSGFIESSPIVDLSASATCTAEQNSPSTFVVLSDTGRPCTVTVQLMNGHTYEVSIAFAQLDPDGCCAGVYSVSGDPTWRLVGGGGDGGVD
jgi:hypothetical protein